MGKHKELYGQANLLPRNDVISNDLKEIFSWRNLNKWYYISNYKIRAKYKLGDKFYEKN